jgi:hypothetical protein
MIQNAIPAVDADQSGKARFPHFFNVDQVKRMAFTAGEDTINRDDAVTNQIDWFVFLRRMTKQVGARSPNLICCKLESVGSRPTPAATHSFT